MLFKWLFKKSNVLHSIEGTVSSVLPPRDDKNFTGFISVPKCDIQALIVDYVACLETEESYKWCRCEWIIHPDDIHLENHRRMHRGETVDDCPVHTKEGLLLYFFEWIFKNNKKV